MKGLDVSQAASGDAGSLPDIEMLLSGVRSLRERTSGNIKTLNRIADALYGPPGPTPVREREVDDGSGAVHDLRWELEELDEDLTILETQIARLQSLA